jgi:hypothetical protein
MNNAFSRYLFTLETEADPQAPARILGLVTRRNVLPSWFSARDLGGDRLRVVIEVRDLDAHGAGYLAKCVLNIPSVISADVRRVAQREAMVA